MAITRDEIAERVSVIHDAQRDFSVRMHLELDSLKELCGGLGHVFGEPMVRWPWGPARKCCVCQQDIYVKDHDAPHITITVNVPPGLTRQGASDIGSSIAKQLAEMTARGN